MHTPTRAHALSLMTLPRCAAARLTAVRVSRPPIAAIDLQLRAPDLYHAPAIARLRAGARSINRCSPCRVSDLFLSHGLLWCCVIGDGDVRVHRG